MTEKHRKVGHSSHKVGSSLNKSAINYWDVCNQACSTCWPKVKGRCKVYKAKKIGYALLLDEEEIIEKEEEKCFILSLLRKIKQVGSLFGIKRG